MTTTTNLGITLLGENQANKYVTTNTAIAALEAALTEGASHSIDSGDTITLTSAQFRAVFALTFTDGGIDAAGTVNFPSIERGLFIVYNDTGQTLTLQISGQSETPPTLSDATYAVFFCDGSNVFKVTDLGGGGGSSTFVALSDTPANFTSAAKKLLRVNAAANAVEFVAPSVEISGQVSGTPTGSAKVFEKVTSSLTFDLATDVTGSTGYLATAPSGSAVAFSIAKNGTPIGTMDFADGSNTATFTVTATSFTSGDRLTITAPASLASAADLSFSLVATRTS